VLVFVIIFCLCCGFAATKAAAAASQSIRELKQQKQGPGGGAAEATDFFSSVALQPAIAAQPSLGANRATPVRAPLLSLFSVCLSICSGI
jgi:hypothetical protein